MPWRKVCFSKRVSLYCSCLTCFFTTFFFTPFAFLVFFRQPQGLSTSLGACQHTLRLLARRTHLSTFSEPSCWPNCAEGGPGGSQTCHRDLDAWPCPGTHPLDLKEKAVSVRVEELAALSVLCFELVVIEIVHQVLGERSRMLMVPYTGRLSTRRILWTWIAAKSSSKVLARANAGLAMSA